MTVAYLASREAQVQAGYLAALITIPTIGLICLIIGLWERSRGRPQTGPYSPRYPTAPHIPVNPRYQYPLRPPPPPMGYQGPYPGPSCPRYPPGFPPQRRAGKSANALITIGIVLLALSGLGILGNFARVASEQSERPHNTNPFATTMRVGECIDQSPYLAESFSSRPNNDCANPAATYELAFKGGASATCPDGKREHSVYDRYTDESTILCFALNLQQRQCYQMMNDGENLTMRLGDCTQPRPLQARVIH